MGDLIRDLEDQKALIDAQVSEIEERKKEIVSLEMKMKEEQIRLEKKMLTARRDEAKKFAKKLEEKEQILEDILEKLKKDPSRKLIAKSWDSIKVVKREAIDEAENVPSVLKARKNAEKAAEQTQRELVPLSDLPNRPLLKVNDVLTVCMKGALLGREAKVISDNGKTLEVNVSGLSMTLKHKDLSMVPSGGATTSTGVRSDKTADGQKTSRLSKSVEMALMSESNGRGNSRGSVDDAERPKKRGIAMRTDSNTVDVRGCNLEAAQEKIQSKISECMMSGHSSIYVLHGHGSGGVLKSKLRNWFKSETRLIMKYAPADGPDGGDAFTRLELS
jgi:dsDNA-specific endonuclease/ATPase MutS2